MNILRQNLAARREWDATHVTGYGGRTRLMELGRSAVASWHAPSMVVIRDFNVLETIETLQGRDKCLPSRQMIEKHMSLVETYLRRVRPLSASFAAVLTSSDITPQILAGCDDEVHLSRVACVCKAWAAKELQRELWKALVLRRWPRNGLCHVPELSWQRKYRLLSNHDRRGNETESEWRSELRLNAEYDFVCVVTDPDDGSLLFVKNGVLDHENLDFRWSDEDASEHPLLPSKYFELFDRAPGWGLCGKVTVNLYVKRLRDQRVAQLAIFDVHLGMYRYTDPNRCHNALGEAVSLFYGGVPGVSGSERILLPSMWVPSAGSSAEPSFSRVIIELFCARAGYGFGVSGSEGHETHDADTVAARVVPLSAESEGNQSACRLCHFRLMLRWGEGSIEEASHVPVDLFESLASEPFSSTDLLTIVESADWA